MKVSALIPTYNRQPYVLRAIDSVLAQTEPVDEIVVVDDGSSDGTSEAIESKYGDRVRLIRQANTGVSGARHRAIEEARGEWIAFLDSDDVWTPERNREFLEAIKIVPKEVAWVFADMVFVTDEGEIPSFFQKNGLTVTGPVQVFSDGLTVVYPNFYSYLPASMIRRDVLVEADCFSSGLRSDEDWLAAVQIGSRYAFAGLPIIASRISRTSDLLASSLFHQRRRSLDRDRLSARRMIFSLLAVTKGRRSWGDCYAAETRELCKLDASEGKGIRRRAFEQFRYTISLKSIVFLFAVMFGQSGLRVWEAMKTRVVQENRAN